MVSYLLFNDVDLFQGLIEFSYKFFTSLHLGTRMHMELGTTHSKKLL